jgi:hypothetical protein
MNVHFYPAEFLSQSRIMREIRSILKLQIVSNVVALGVTNGSLPTYELVSEDFAIIRVKINKIYYVFEKFGKLYELIQYIIKSIYFCFKYKPDIVNCHSLNTLFIGYFYKILFSNIRLIYDAHELETERVGLRGSAQLISRFFERIMIKKVDHVIVVCDPIRDWYQNKYKVGAISVVRNMSTATADARSMILREKLGIPDDVTLFIYQGILTRERGIYDLMEAFSGMDDTNHIVFMGFGPSQEDVIACATKVGNVHFHPAVPLEQIGRYTSGADVGVMFICGDLCKSYELSLPNKFFEYVSSGCAVLVSENLTYLSGIIATNVIGWSTSADVDSLIRALSKLSPADIREKREAAQRFARTHHWEVDEENYRLAFGFENDTTKV